MAQQTPFGRRLQRSRLEHGWSLAHAGRLAGVNPSTWFRWEGGLAEPELAQIERLAAILGVSPCWLAFGLGRKSTGGKP